MSGPARVYEIYSAQVKWSDCEDMRPWIVVDLHGESCGCFPIASECYLGNCFYLDIGDPDFRATGLTKSCHIHYASIIEFSQSRLERRRGELTGDLLARFVKEAGLA